MSNGMGIGDWRLVLSVPLRIASRREAEVLEIGKDVFSIYISLIRSEFSVYLCAPTSMERQSASAFKFQPSIRYDFT